MWYACNEKWQMTYDWPNQDKIRTLGENDAYKYLEILEADTKQVQMKDKIKKKYLRRRNLIKRMNTWTIHRIRYVGTFLKWIKDGLKQMDQSSRKLMTMHEALHPRDDIDRVYVTRKEWGRGLPASKTPFMHRYNDSKTT